jgi:hypothetical protein
VTAWGTFCESIKEVTASQEVVTPVPGFRRNDGKGDFLAFYETVKKYPNGMAERHGPVFRWRKNFARE